MKNRNFEDLKVGDVVACAVHIDRKMSLLKVAKVTKTTFTAGETVFNKSSGDARGKGNTWIYPSAWIPTEEEKQEIANSIKTRKLRTQARFLLQQVSQVVEQLSDNELALLIQELRLYVNKRKAE
jgi:hypothetical protein